MNIIKCENCGIVTGCGQENYYGEQLCPGCYDREQDEIQEAHHFNNLEAANELKN